MKNITTSKASFFKNIRNTVLISGLGLAIALMPSCKKADNPIPQTKAAPAADYGNIHYTMTSHAGKVTKDEKLKSTSACHTGTMNVITLGDAYNRFNIVINGAAAMKNGTYSVTGSTGSITDDYSTAKYNWTDVHSGKSGSANFTEGESEITDYRPNDKVVKVQFHYSLVDPDHNNETVTLDGYAVINNVVEHK